MYYFSDGFSQNTDTEQHLSQSALNCKMKRQMEQVNCLTERTIRCCLFVFTNLLFTKIKFRFFTPNIVLVSLWRISGAEKQHFHWTPEFKHHTYKRWTFLCSIFYHMTYNLLARDVWFFSFWIQRLQLS